MSPLRKLYILQGEDNWIPSVSRKEASGTTVEGSGVYVVEGEDDWIPVWRARTT